jgi:hypothetical protein
MQGEILLRTMSKNPPPFGTFPSFHHRSFDAYHAFPPLTYQEKCRITPKSSSMTTKAVLYVEKGKAAVQDVSIPKLRDEYILVKVNAVGVNPADWKNIDYGNTDAGSRIGCDYAGVVEAVGSKVTKLFKKGDRICGFVHGAWVVPMKLVKWYLTTSQ